MSTRSNRQSAGTLQGPMRDYCGDTGVSAVVFLFGTSKYQCFTLYIVTFYPMVRIYLVANAMHWHTLRGIYDLWQCCFRYYIKIKISNFYCTLANLVVSPIMGIPHFSWFTTMLISNAQAFAIGHWEWIIVFHLLYHLHKKKRIKRQKFSHQDTRDTDEADHDHWTFTGLALGIVRK